MMFSYSAMENPYEGFLSKVSLTGHLTSGEET